MENCNECWVYKNTINHRKACCDDCDGEPMGIVGENDFRCMKCNRIEKKSKVKWSWYLGVQSLMCGGCARPRVQKSIRVDAALLEFIDLNYDTFQEAIDDALLLLIDSHREE